MQLVFLISCLDDANLDIRLLFELGCQLNFMILDSEKSEEKPQLENMESKPVAAPTEADKSTANPAPSQPPVALEGNEDKGSGNPIEGKNYYNLSVFNLLI